MTGSIPDPDPLVQPDHGSTAGTPLWVKVFGIIALVVVLLVGAALLTGIGGSGGHGPGRHAPSSGADRHPSSVSGRESDGSVGGPAAADEAVRAITITALDAMAFVPSNITVAARETVTFVVTNTGRSAHEFTLGDASMQQEHAREVARMGGGTDHDTPNSIRLLPGETKQLTWRFGDAGTLEYACHEPGHYQARMRGRITIV